MGIGASKKRTVLSGTEIDYATQYAFTGLYLIPTIAGIIMSTISTIFALLMSLVTFLFMFVTIFLWIILFFALLKFTWGTTAVIFEILFAPLLEVFLVFVTLSLNFAIVVSRIAVTAWNMSVPFTGLLMAILTQWGIAAMHVVTTTFTESGITRVVFEIGQLMTDITTMFMGIAFSVIDTLPGLFRVFSGVMPIVTAYLLTVSEVIVDVTVNFLHVIWLPLRFIVHAIVSLIRHFRKLLKRDVDGTDFESALMAARAYDARWGTSFVPSGIPFVALSEAEGARIWEDTSQRTEAAQTFLRNGAWSRSGADPPHQQHQQQQQQEHAKRADTWEQASSDTLSQQHVNIAGATHDFVARLGSSSGYYNWDMASRWMNPVYVHAVQSPPFHVAPDVLAISERMFDHVFGERVQTVLESSASVSSSNVQERRADTDPAAANDWRTYTERQCDEQQMCVNPDYGGRNPDTRKRKRASENIDLSTIVHTRTVADDLYEYWNVAMRENEDSTYGDGSISSVGGVHPHDLPVSLAWGHTHHHTRYESLAALREEARSASAHVFGGGRDPMEIYNDDDLEYDLINIGNPERYNLASHMRVRRFLATTARRTVSSVLHNTFNTMPPLHHVVKAVTNMFDIGSAHAGFQSAAEAVAHYHAHYASHPMRLLYDLVPDPTGHPVWELLRALEHPDDRTQRQFYHDWVRNPTPVRGLLNSDLINHQMRTMGMPLDGRPKEEQMRMVRDKHATHAANGIPLPPTAIRDHKKHRDRVFDDRGAEVFDGLEFTHNSYVSSQQSPSSSSGREGQILSTEMLAESIAHLRNSDGTAKAGGALLHDLGSAFAPDLSNLPHSHAEQQAAIMQQYLQHVSTMAKQPDAPAASSASFSQSPPSSHIREDRAASDLDASPSSHTVVHDSVRRQPGADHLRHEPFDAFRWHAPADTLPVAVVDVGSVVDKSIPVLHAFLDTHRRWIEEQTRQQQQLASEQITNAGGSADTPKSDIRVHNLHGRFPIPTPFSAPISIDKETNVYVDDPLSGFTFITIPDCYTTNPRSFMCLPAIPTWVKVPLLKFELPLSGGANANCPYLLPLPATITVSSILDQFNPIHTFYNSFQVIRIWISFFTTFTLKLSGLSLKYPLFKNVFTFILIVPPGEVVPITTLECTLFYIFDLLVSALYLYLLFMLLPPLWGLVTQIYRAITGYFGYADSQQYARIARLSEPPPSRVFTGPPPGTVTNSQFWYTSRGDKFLTNAMAQWPSMRVRKINFTPADTYTLEPPESMMHSGDVSIMNADAAPPGQHISIGAAFDQPTPIVTTHGNGKRPRSIGLDTLRYDPDVAPAGRPDIEMGPRSRHAAQTMDFDISGMPFTRKRAILDCILNENLHENHLNMIQHAFSDAIDLDTIKMMHRFLGIHPETGALSDSPVRAPGYENTVVQPHTMWVSDTAQLIIPLLKKYHKETQHIDRLLLTAREYGIRPDARYFSRKNFFLWSSIHWWLSAGGDYRNTIIYLDEKYRAMASL